LNKVYLKKDIVRSTSKNCGYSQRVVEEVLDSFYNFLVETVENGDRVQCFGVFDISTKYVEPHTYSNPQDNSIKVPVGERYKLVIKAGDRLKKASRQVIKNIKK
jgi:nucleoid DNA-binding protein